MQIIYDSKTSKAKVQIGIEDWYHGYESCQLQIVDAVGEIISSAVDELGGWRDMNERFRILKELSEQIFKDSIRSCEILLNFKTAFEADDVEEYMQLCRRFDIYASERNLDELYMLVKRYSPFPNVRQEGESIIFELCDENSVHAIFVHSTDKKKDLKDEAKIASFIVYELYRGAFPGNNCNFNICYYSDKMINEAINST